MRVNPIVILLFNLVLPISIMFPGNVYQHYFFLTFAAGVLLAMGKWARLAKFALAYGVLLLLTRLLEVLPSQVSMIFSMLLLVSVQFIPCLMMASVLVLDYTASEIISALEPLRLPKAFAVSLAIVVRYIPTFRKEFAFIKESMRLRGVPYSLWHPVRSFSLFLVPQLFRCSILADEITSAGMTKGMTNPARRSSYFDMRMRTADYLLCAILLAGMGGIILWR